VHHVCIEQRVAPHGPLVGLDRDERLVPPLVGRRGPPMSRHALRRGCLGLVVLEADRHEGVVQLVPRRHLQAHGQAVGPRGDLEPPLCLEPTPRLVLKDKLKHVNALDEAPTLDEADGEVEAVLLVRRAPHARVLGAAHGDVEFEFPFGQSEHHVVPLRDGFGRRRRLRDGAQMQEPEPLDVESEAVVPCLDAEDLLAVRGLRRLAAARTAGRGGSVCPPEEGVVGDARAADDGRDSFHGSALPSHG